MNHYFSTCDSKTWYELDFHYPVFHIVEVTCIAFWFLLSWLIHCTVSGPYPHLAPFFILEAESLYYILTKKKSNYQMNKSQTGIEIASKATMVFNFFLLSINALVLEGFHSVYIFVKWNFKVCKLCLLKSKYSQMCSILLGAPWK